jgi:hypothetical protein
MVNSHNSVALIVAQNGGPTRLRKKLTGESVMLFVQKNGMGGELVVKIVLQSERLVEDWI